MPATGAVFWREGPGAETLPDGFFFLSRKEVGPKFLKFLVVNPPFNKNPVQFSLLIGAVDEIFPKLLVWLVVYTSFYKDAMQLLKFFFHQ